MKGSSLLWKIPLGVIGTVLGLVLLLIVAAGCVIYVPTLRAKAVEKGLTLANEKSDMDMDLGYIYLSPFYHSPMVLYRAYKGEEDLPLEVNIDSLFVGHRGVDTLLYAHALRLKAVAKTSGFSFQDSAFTSLPIVVEKLQIDKTTFHSDTMIAAVGIDALIGHLEVNSPELIIAKGQYPLHGLRLNDTYVSIDLRDTPPDTTAQDTTPMLMAFDVPDGELRNLRFRLTPIDLDLRLRALSTQVLADVGANKYDARRIRLIGTQFQIGDVAIPIDTLYGDACVDLSRNLITSRGLHVRSDEIGACADLSSTKMNLETMRVDVNCDADYQGSKAQVSGFYDIDDEAYSAHIDIEKVNLAPFMQDKTRVVLAGDIDAEGRGINPKRAMKTNIRMHMQDCIYEEYDLSGLDMNFSTDETTALNLKTQGLKVDVSSPMPLFHLIDSIQPLVAAVSDTTLMSPLSRWLR